MHRAVPIGEPEERAIRRTMPPEQRKEFTCLSGLTHRADFVLTPVVDDLSYQVKVLALRWLLLHAIARCGFERSVHAYDASLLAHVPIRASEHERLVAEARAEYVPLAEAVEIVVAARGVGERVAARELREAVANKHLHSRGRGSSAEFVLGTLHDWLGVEFPLVPAWGRAYDVVPDDGWRPEHERLRQAAETFARLGTFGPGAPALALSAPGDTWDGADNDTSWNEVMRLLVEQLRTGLSSAWGQLLAIERVAADVCRRFGDDAVLPDRLRARLDLAHADLQAVHDAVPPLAGEIAAPAVDEHGMTVLRRAIFG